MIEDGATGGSLMCLTDSCVVLPENGICPVSISNSTQPSAYRSDDGVGIAERICSGAMYSGVPTIMF
ncbi:hypothetical protein D3C83_86120 [compost metagenome]